MQTLNLEGNCIAQTDDIFKMNLFTLGQLKYLKYLNLSNNNIYRIYLDFMYNNNEINPNNLFETITEIDLSKNNLN